MYILLGLVIYLTCFYLWFSSWKDYYSNCRSRPTPLTIILFGSWWCIVPLMTLVHTVFFLIRFMDKNPNPVYHKSWWRRPIQLPKIVWVK